MTTKTPSNFRPRIIEPAVNGGVGLAVELEFYEAVPGVANSSITLYCRDTVTMEQAEALREMLGAVVYKVSTR
jgi:hypothetical protein